MKQKKIKKNSDNQEIILRPVLDEDLEIFFEQMSDPEAHQMAAFTSKDPYDKEGFEQKWEKIRNDKNTIIRTIILDGNITGHIAKYILFNKPEITYWIGKKYWNQGIATKALILFSEMIEERPLYARAANDNIGSIKVLKKCGFEVIGREKSFANAREMEIEEVIFRLK